MDHNDTRDGKNYVLLLVNIISDKSDRKIFVMMILYKFYVRGVSSLFEAFCEFRPRVWISSYGYWPSLLLYLF